MSNKKEDPKVLTKKGFAIMPRITTLSFKTPSGSPAGDERESAVVQDRVACALQPYGGWKMVA